MKITEKEKTAGMIKKMVTVGLVASTVLGLTACGTNKSAGTISLNRENFQKAFNKMTKNKKVHEAVLYVETSDGSFSENYGYGNRTIDSPMICASVTKMFTTACVLKLCDEGKLSLDDKISDYFTEEQMKGLHIYKGHEYSNDLTVYHLLSQTSGLPDDSEDGDNSYIMESDEFLTFDKKMKMTKEQTPRFAPGTGDKANYANINFDLLGLIMEEILNKPLAEIYDEIIFTPLAMEKTYLADENSGEIPYSFYDDEKIERPLMIESAGAAGGCISTPRDLMVFSKAFWGGKLFDSAVFDKLTNYKSLQSSKGPINYGGGYMEIPLKGITTMFMGKGELLGHSGTTGSFMFYYPEEDIHFVGDLTQTSNPALPIRFVMQLAMTK